MPSAGSLERRPGDLGEAEAAGGAQSPRWSEPEAHRNLEVKVHHLEGEVHHLEGKVHCLRKLIFK